MAQLVCPPMATRQWQTNEQVDGQVALCIYIHDKMVVVLKGLIAWSHVKDNPTSQHGKITFTKFFWLIVMSSAKWTTKQSSIMLQVTIWFNGVTWPLDHLDNTEQQEAAVSNALPLSSCFPKKVLKWTQQLATYNNMLASKWRSLESVVNLQKKTLMGLQVGA